MYWLMAIVFWNWEGWGGYFSRNPDYFWLYGGQRVW